MCELHDTGKGKTVIANPLDDIAERIRSAVAAGRAQSASGLRSFMQAGDELIKAKQLLPHSEWGKWLAENCDLSPRTARLYMQLAHNRASIAVKMASVADLTIEAALGRAGLPRADRPFPGEPAGIPDTLEACFVRKAERANNLAYRICPEQCTKAVLDAARTAATAWAELVRKLEALDLPQSGPKSEVEEPRLNALGKPYSANFDPNYRIKNRTPTYAYLRGHVSTAALKSGRTREEYERLMKLKNPNWEPLIGWPSA
jgi:Protein of unknown function (DUF3102)